MKPILRWGLTLITVAGLVIDAYVHWHLAHDYVGLPSPSFITQFGLFKFEAVLAVVSALALLVRPNRVTALIAAVVGLGGAAALFVYYQWDPGRIGPLPDMADHTWNPSPDKKLSFYAELIGGIAALGLVAVLPKRSTLGELFGRGRSTITVS